jgi:hypothetical protein
VCCEVLQPAGLQLRMLCGCVPCSHMSLHMCVLPRTDHSDLPECYRDLLYYFFWVISFMKKGYASTNVCSGYLSYTAARDVACAARGSHSSLAVLQITVILISNFRRVLNVVLFLLGNSPASEF